MCSILIFSNVLAPSLIKLKTILSMLQNGQRMSICLQRSLYLCRLMNVNIGGYELFISSFFLFLSFFLFEKERKID